MLQAGRELDFHQLVAAFFWVDTGHDCQIDGLPQGNEISIALVLDLQGFFFLSLLVILAIIAIVVLISILVITSLS